MKNQRESSWQIAGAALALYTTLALLMTWPLARGFASDVPGDLGDSLLNMWILGWGAEHLPRLLTGQASLSDYWNANIFHPAPLALGFSEHLFGEVLQILPVYWLTGNLILCYNLLFISSFALSGLGMFLLVRDLLRDDSSSANPGSHGSAPAGPASHRTGPASHGTGPASHATAPAGPGFSPGVLAALVAGLIFAFIPFRIAQVAHIQSLQAQWMPLALYGFRRYVGGGHSRALAGGAAALLMQNWSNGYYMIYFGPFVPLFVLHQMWAAGRLREWRMWAGFAAAAGVVAVGTWPFVTLYLETARVHGFERPVGEVIGFSADVYSYLTAPEALRVWGDVLRAYPKPEGELFFGVVPWLLALIAILAGLKAGPAAWRVRHSFQVAAHGSPAAAYRARAVRIGFLTAAVSAKSVARGIPAILLAVIAIQSIGFIAILFTGGFITSFAGIPIRATNPTRILIGIAVATAVLLATSRRARERTRQAARSPLLVCAVFTIVALWLSLGPLPQSHGRTLQGFGLYAFLYEHVPGFDGLRVPARYAMVAAMFLSVVAGYGAAALLRWRTWITASRNEAAFASADALTKAGLVPLASVVAVVFLVEVAFLPMTINATWHEAGVPPPARIAPATDAPPVYHTLADLPDDTIVAEFPFGDPAWELRYVYYSTVHWKRLLNGYSGAFPQAYYAHVALLQRVRENPDAAWRALRDAGTTHVVVHGHAMAADDTAFIIRWLEDHFAVEIARFNDTLLFDLDGVLQ